MMDYGSSRRHEGHEDTTKPLYKPFFVRFVFFVAS
jgi:hypothetical protein